MVEAFLIKAWNPWPPQNLGGLAKFIADKHDEITELDRKLSQILESWQLKEGLGRMQAMPAAASWGVVSQTLIPTVPRLEEDPGECLASERSAQEKLDLVLRNMEVHRMGIIVIRFVPGICMSISLWVALNDFVCTCGSAVSAGGLGATLIRASVFG